VPRSRKVVGPNGVSAKGTLTMKKMAKTAQRNPTGLSADSTQFSALEKGQVWKLGDGETFVQITDAGKRLIHYRIVKTLQQRGMRTQMASIETVRAFLKSNGGELLPKS
jgi:hypothetical protein